MFEAGFLGTRALWFMDVVTLWFAVLPFLMGGAIYLAMRKRERAHKRAQTILFAVTLAMVVLFEVGVRFTGGFVAYAEKSGVAFSSLAVLLAVHILIAVAAVAGWAWLLIDALLSYGRSQAVAATHRRNGLLVFAGMTVTSLMGVTIYGLLFIL
jgi:putative membrane protein